MTDHPHQMIRLMSVRNIMAIKLNTVKCPECGSELSYEDGRSQLFCSYCGSKIVITNENEQIYRHIDEAGVKRAETELRIRMKELEMQEARQKQKDQLRKILTWIWIGSIFVVAIICLVVWLTNKEYGSMEAFMCLFYIGGPVVGGGAYLLFVVMPESENNKYLLQNGGIRFPKNYDSDSDITVDAAEQMLRNAGFTNVTTVNMQDNTFGLLYKPGTVESITVDGKEISKGGKVYSPDVPITITYHGRRERNR